MSQKEEKSQVIEEKTTVEPVVVDTSKSVLNNIAGILNESGHSEGSAADEAGKTIAQPLNLNSLPTDSSVTSPVDFDQSVNSSEKYEVKVHRYAHYEDTGDVYSQEMQNSLNYASRTPFGRFFYDFVFILTRPESFWKAQELHPVTLGQLIWPHLVILVVLRMIAVFVGGILMSEPVISTVLIQTLMQGFLIFVLVLIFALLISGISALTGAGFQLDKGIRFSGYCITPILLMGIISIIPVPYLGIVCDMLAMPWAFVVLGAGVLPYLKIKPERSPSLTGLFCGILVILWSVLPLLIPNLIGLLKS